jgi:CheY-like chemotaxis protein
LRLGNQDYPFMKFVVQEFVHPGNFYFAVDTHDEMKISPDVPGYEEFLDVRAFNRKLKCSIEMAWTDHGLPTMSNLHTELAGTAPSRTDDRPFRARVLVVDDDEALAGVMEAILSKHGFDVAKAQDGQTALEAVRASSFDLVVCDYQMPVMDGAGFCEALHALHAGQETRCPPVLLTTAAALALSDITDKANGFLVKPYREDVLMGLIENLLEYEPDCGWNDS